ncbi:MAG: hypothetical protein ACRDBM_02160, partial [Sporomusa sp.]
VTKTQNDEDIAALQGEIDKTGLELIGVIPYYPQVAKFDLLNQPLFDLPDSSAAVQAVNEICKKVEV